MTNGLAAETWRIHKPTAESRRGVVASQHRLASQVGVEVLREGGNAVDAAVATGLAIGTVEPWSSGIGGGGYMLIYRADSASHHLIEFGMRAPFDATRDDYPLDQDRPTTSAYSFNWPAVKEDRNVSGPLSIAVPGYLRGVDFALRKFGTMAWSEVIEPACLLAEQGLPVDWFVTMHITGLARGLRRFDESRRVYLSDGLPPTSRGEGMYGYLQLGKLADTFRTLRRSGPDCFYEGEIADALVDDLQSLGSRITRRDLSEYAAQEPSPCVTEYRDAHVVTGSDLTAGPSLVQALGYLAEHEFAEQAPSAEDVCTYIDALRRTYSYRLKHLGAGRGDSHTSHICTSDSDGNLVALTQTIMSPFGSHVMSPSTGVLFNNGMMWFDPRADAPNSLIGGRRPLCNMCPTIVTAADGSRVALGACGGRKIFPSVLQLISFVLDFNMNVDSAVHAPRVDVSGNENIWVMDHFPADIKKAVLEQFKEARFRPNGVGSNQFAVPQIVRIRADGTHEGNAYVPSPHACALGA